MTLEHAVTNSPSHALAHTAIRHTVALNQPLDSALTRFEELVPVADFAAFRAASTWEQALELVAANAPMGLMRFWSLDVAAVLAGSGTPVNSVEYLIGNHTIAEKMIRHHPEVVLYAPLRTAIYAGTDGGALLVIDQPGPLFASFGIAEIATIGEHLDHLVADLLDALGATTPPELRAAR
jgi:uncharacterized protein (DUF302 family)